MYIVFGGDSEKIEGDGTDMTISANNLTIDAAADISLDGTQMISSFLLVALRYLILQIVQVMLLSNLSLTQKI